MKFSIDIVIDVSLDAVWQLFDNPDNMKKWQPTLESFTHKSGDPGQSGAVAELIYDEKGRKIPIIETVTERREPHFMAGTYESAMGKAIIVNHFEEVEENRTRWVMYTNHTFNGIFKLLSIFFGGSIRKRNEEVMNNFKLFAETEQAERAR
ncbi:MAG: SRPBCC family protein [Woeseiaceae bacterium]|nr:SRPBCC family protein [Woeseiaceae bacterium]